MTALEAVKDFRILVGDHEKKWDKKMYDHFMECLDVIEEAVKMLDERNKLVMYLNDVVVEYRKEVKAFKIVKNFIHLNFEYTNLSGTHYTISASGEAHIDQDNFELMKEALKWD